jgi:very-short-patch-repair endonuclease
MGVGVQENKSEPEPHGTVVPPALLSGLCKAYADLLRRQRTASNALVTWSKVTSRSHEFAWLGGELSTEQLMHAGKPLRVSRENPLFESVQRMHGTARLNPYEREVLYGYPYVIGRMSGKSVRGPLLTVPVGIEPEGSGFVVHPSDEVVRFNSLPFRAREEAPVHDEAISRIIEATPAFPLRAEALNPFVDVIRRELPSVEVRGGLDGGLAEPPEEPKQGEFLALIDQAALFVAPKTSYFLASDLEAIAELDGSDCGALAPLVVGAGDEESAEFALEDLDRTSIFYPYPSNRSQRRVALLTDHPTTRVVRVEGPPGTGKSLTIANLACHLAATGRTVLVTSQKDKALQVVDDMLARLNLPELPMTLLRQDKDSKKDLMARLDRIKKHRGMKEVEHHYQEVREGFARILSERFAEFGRYAQAIRSEELLEKSHRHLQASRGLRRLAGRMAFWRANLRARRMASRTTDEISKEAAARRSALLEAALRVLQLGAELGVATAKRGERQQLRELSAVLRRDQTKYKNFSLFDRLKSHPEWGERLLKQLPVWILTPDDAARLFPAKPGLFDVVVVDEASQVDLPSVMPIAFRGKKIVMFGDTRQMQPRRFAFVARQVAHQAWRHFDMHRQDPDGWLEPMQQSLLTLGAIRAEEENLLDEHFRSLPPIIQFSNERWYNNELRVMTDERRKRFGGPDQPIVQLHQVEDGEISNRSQENEIEAHALVDFLAKMVEDPDYAGASIGVACLFEEQVALIQELVTDRIEPEEWEEHDLVVVNPDGFQGDERDIILYSLSWDNRVMPRQALSQRQRESPHEQGMLNVAFTRGRDELHIFHSAPVDTFTKADGSSGALTDWLRYCQSVQESPRPRLVRSRVGQVDSEFEAEVAAALEERGVRVLHQYPACGFSIDLVCEKDEHRVAVECDGWTHHTDEHGRLRIEDLERQGILERAGWHVTRIPYRKWLKEPEAQVARVLASLQMATESPGNGPGPNDADAEAPSFSGTRPVVHRVTREEGLIMEVVGGGIVDQDDVLRAVREALGYKRLGKRIRDSLFMAARNLNHRGLLEMEEGEFFLTPDGRSAELQLVRGGLLEASAARRASTARRPRSTGRIPGSRKPNAESGRCSCGGGWVLRRGRYGRFYGCSRFPYCRRTRPYR